MESWTDYRRTGYPALVAPSNAVVKAQTQAFLAETQDLAPEKTGEWMATRYDCRVAEVVNQMKGVFCMIPKKGVKLKRAVRPLKETPHYFATSASSPDLQTAMNEASFAMIEQIAERKNMSTIDAYSLMSLTMDSRLGDIAESKKTVHCLVPKNLWTV